jgi:hypothetical protein
VLAYGRGGALDSVAPGVSGLFFKEQTVESLIEGVQAMEAWLPDFDPDAAIAQAERFAPERFDDGIADLLRSHGWAGPLNLDRSKLKLGS